MMGDAPSPPITPDGNLPNHEIDQYCLFYDWINKKSDVFLYSRLKN